MHSTISEDGRDNDCPTNCSATIEVRGVEEDKDAPSNQEDKREEDEEEQLFAGIIAAIDIGQLQAFVLAIRKETSPNLTDDLICTVHLSSLVQDLTTSCTKLSSRMTCIGQSASLPPATSSLPHFAQTMHLDIVAQRLVASKTSTPLPHIHHWVG